MNFITMAEAMYVVLTVRGPRRAARYSDGIARASWTNHLDIFESRDVAGICAVDERLERESSLSVGQTGKIKRPACVA